MIDYYNNDTDINININNDPSTPLLVPIDRNSNNNNTTSSSLNTTITTGSTISRTSTIGDSNTNSTSSDAFEATRTSTSTSTSTTNTSLMTTGANTNTTTGGLSRRNTTTNNTDTNTNTHNSHSPNSTNAISINNTKKSYTRIINLFLSPFTDDTGSCQSIIFGLVSLFIFGTIIGLIVSSFSSTNTGQHELPYPYSIISTCIGCIYFISWSISFYPQIIQNYKRCTTIGLSIDFCCLNIIGFTFYTIYTCSLYYNTTIRDQFYKFYGPNSFIGIQFNDVAFAIHALVLASITLLQVLYYDGIQLTIQRLSKFTITIIFTLLSIATIGPIVILVLEHTTTTSDTKSTTTFTWLQYIYLLSYMKIFISIIKYIPQVVLNYKNQSTIGWSIWQILLDLLGGILSDVQLIADSWYTVHNFTPITDNIPKFCLGLVSILFDIIFLFQHYVLYGTNLPTTSTTPLLLPTNSIVHDNNTNTSSINTRTSPDGDVSVPETAHLLTVSDQE